MDILFYTSSLGGGGAEKHVQRIANAIHDEGHCVTVAVARQGRNYEKELSGDVDLKVLSNGWINSSTWRLMCSVRPLRRHVSNCQPDVVCSVMDHVNVRLVRALNGIVNPPPAVLSVQNNPTIRFGERASWRERVLFWRMRRSYPKAERIVAVSQGVAKELVEMGLAGPDQLSVIPNAGIDANVPDAKDVHLGERVRTGKSLLVACGSLTHQKGYPYLLEAFRQVRSQEAAELWILGEGDQRDNIESRVTELGLEEHVSLLGFRDNPFKFMAMADVFVLSSLWEGFGNVIVEAMACGTPVVSTDCPHGPGEIISHEENGLLVPPADADALSEALLRVLRDQCLQGKMAENGKERAHDFHASKIGQQYLDLFRDVVSQSRDSSQTPSERTK